EPSGQPSEKVRGKHTAPAPQRHPPWQYPCPLSSAVQCNPGQHSTLHSWPRSLHNPPVQPATSITTRRIGTRPTERMLAASAYLRKLRTVPFAVHRRSWVVESTPGAEVGGRPRSRPGRVAEVGDLPRSRFVRRRRSRRSASIATTARRRLRRSPAIPI